jgi:hypothetical protein
MLLPFKDVDERRIFPGYMHGHRQRLEVRRKLNLPGRYDFAFGLAFYFYGACVESVGR